MQINEKKIIVSQVFPIVVSWSLVDYQENKTKTTKMYRIKHNLSTTYATRLISGDVKARYAL